MADILKDIDEALRRNAERFDPFGPPPLHKSGIEEEAVPTEAVPESPWIDISDQVRRVDSPEPGHIAFTLDNSSGRFTRFELLATEEPDGSAPNDRAADAFRSEVRRQGLAPCEIEIDGRTEWLPAAEFTVDSQVEAFRQEETLWADPGAPLVDAALEPNPDGPYRTMVLGPGVEVRELTNEERIAFMERQHRSIECGAATPMCSGCDGLSLDWFPCMHDCHAEPARRPWWRRWLP